MEITAVENCAPCVRATCIARAERMRQMPACYVYHNGFLSLAFVLRWRQTQWQRERKKEQKLDLGEAEKTLDKCVNVVCVLRDIGRIRMTFFGL